MLILLFKYKIKILSKIEFILAKTEKKELKLKAPLLFVVFFLIVIVLYSRVIRTTISDTRL